MTDDVQATAPAPDPLVPEGFDLALVLGGGNALGAYHLGVCEALAETGAAPGHVVGASIGAVTGAILLGNPPEARLGRLRELWAGAAQPGAPWLGLLPDEARARWSNLLGLHAALTGRPGLSAMRLPGLWSILPGMPPDRAVQDLSPLRRSLDRLVDWDLLNAGPARFSALAIDADTAEEVWFDTAEGVVGPDEVLASASLLPLFPPVLIGGRRLVDAGLRDNLPVRRAFTGPQGRPLARPLLCLASDLYGVGGVGGGVGPHSLDRSVTRAQDLGFAAQGRRGIDLLARERALLRRLDPAEPPAILAHLAQDAGAHERSLKALDFSATALAERAARGRRDLVALVPLIDAAPRDEALAVVRLP